MQILNTASYKFIALDALADLQGALRSQCQRLQLKGTILLSREGINLNLAGVADAVNAFKNYLQTDRRFSDAIYKDSYSDYVPFNCLKVKVKNEIITMRSPDIHPEKGRAPAISPIELKQWLDEKKEITLVDTRNDYEVRFGTFKDAVNLQTKDFSEFPSVSRQISRDKPIVMFCTGGIRCEKAAQYLLETGAREVYQLEGGILNYFKEAGGAHYEGECFVFDQRVTLDIALRETETQQCTHCQGPMNPICHPCEQQKETL